MSKGTKLLKVGDILPYKFGQFEVLEYLGCKKVKVKFLDENGYERFVTAGDAVLGKISNPYSRNCHGVGYLGVGEYSPKTNKVEYTLWSSMFARCYTEYSNRNTRSYSNKSVLEVWHNFQKFAEWCQSQNGFGVKGWQLDKDILVKGNTFYGPDFCVFVPQRVNLLFVKSDATRGQYPVGIIKCGKWFHVSCTSKERKSSYVGIFENVEDAFLAYKSTKEEIIKEVATFYRGVLDEKTYQALIDYKVEESD